MIIFEGESAFGTHCFKFFIRFRVLLLGLLRTIVGEMFRQGALALETRGFGAVCLEVSGTVTSVAVL